VKPAAGYRLLAYSSPEPVQTTGTVAVSNPSSIYLKIGKCNSGTIDLLWNTRPSE
jgi:hypothetical protein